MNSRGAGRPPKPRAVHEAQGTKPRKPGVHPPESKRPVEKPIMNEGASAVWDRLAPGLIERNILTFDDIDEFATWCMAVDAWQQATDHLDTNGHVLEEPIVNRVGDIVGHKEVLSKWFYVQKEANATMLRLSSRFGLTPADRAGLRIDTSPPADDQSPERLLTG